MTNIIVTLLNINGTCSGLIKRSRISRIQYISAILGDRGRATGNVDETTDAESRGAVVADDGVGLGVALGA